MDVSLPDLEVFIWNLPEPSQERAAVEALSSQRFRSAASLASVSCGGGKAAFLTRESRVYLMDMGRAAGPPQPQAYTGPRLVQVLRAEETACVSCGRSHVIAVTKSGAAYRLLEGGPAPAAEQSGASRLATSGRLQRLELSVRATRVSCGDGHALLATDTGALFAVGEGKFGQLGLGDVKVTMVPLRVMGLEHVRVIDVAAGCSHSCATAKSGNLFTWGSNAGGQLGDGERTSSCKAVPSCVGSLERVVQVAASSGSAALGASGAVYAWGFGAKMSPVRVFNCKARSVTLSTRVLCAISDLGDLMVQWVDAPNKDVMVLQNGVLTVSVEEAQVVALVVGGGQSLDAQIPHGLRREAVEPHEVEVGGGSLPHKGLKDLHATNEHLSRVRDEVHAEHFLEAEHLRSLAETFKSRTARTSQALADARARLSDLSTFCLKTELAKVRMQIKQTLARHELDATTWKEELRETSGFSPDSTTLAAQHIVRDLRKKHAELAAEHLNLQYEGQSFQEEIAALRDEAMERSRQLRHVEDACGEARVEAERQRSQAELQEQRALRQEEASAEAAAVPAPLQRSGPLDAPAGGRVAAHESLLSELISLTQMHTSTEQKLAAERSECARQESLVGRLRTEQASATVQVEDLERRHAESRARARIATLRSELVAAEACESEMKQELHHCAYHFSQEMAPWYAKLHELHSARLVPD